ncbi:conserved protein of unknown function [Rhodovastum atsumiense]|nr:conserved protein of unknown function [Rhodovastum atsumiense]
MGGGASAACRRSRSAWGPSPRGRGSLFAQVGNGLRSGSIPAWAGEPRHDPSTCCPMRVHPRVGGGAGGSVSPSAVWCGPSPRGRGSPCRGWIRGPRPGSIPAWAGEPACCTAERAWSRVHPRVGGGAQHLARLEADAPGPSPRGRGSRGQRGGRGVAAGSIPAWAGEPSHLCSSQFLSRVHPRVGGGAQDGGGGAVEIQGPSPRGRGSPVRTSDTSEGLRSIPAWAGEPAVARNPGRQVQVHPRVGGGAAGRLLPQSLGRGPSPRGRGSRAFMVPPVRRSGSIPAWAGEPLSLEPVTLWGRVHPRVGGGAPRAALLDVADRVHPRVGGGAAVRVVCVPGVEGPSPRGRGSLRSHDEQPFVVGSIPAWAGEPGCEINPALFARVHPRVGGGAASADHADGVRTGPSPRGRGSPHRPGHDEATSRSIPAWAGEPPGWRAGGHLQGVHPRVGGGACTFSGLLTPLRGPSPRGRGSRQWRQRICLIQGSIPAWAGEPLSRSTPVSPTWVHPRVGGGAPLRRAHGGRLRGPSPRGRGSRSGVPWRGPGCGSIPAWAGEPCRRRRDRSSPRVHPRVGGGARPGR